MKQIAKSRGYDATGEDVEFTDWRALDAFVAGFVAAEATAA
jgi:hypothetical protein